MTVNHYAVAPPGRIMYDTVKKHSEGFRLRHWGYITGR